MDQETYYITEVVSETESKPAISRIDNKIGWNGNPLSFNNAEARGSVSFQRNRKRRRVMKVSTDDKRLLAKLVEKEPALWDMNNELHFHGPALTAAWRRISKQMGDRDVSECKIIWNSLRDAVRYRKNKIARTADDEPRDELDEYEMDSSNCEFSDCLAFLMDTSIAKRPQRSFPIDFGHPQTSETRKVSVDSTSTPTSAKRNAPTECNDDTSVSESSFGYTAPNKQQQQQQQQEEEEDDPLLVESMVNMANSIKELAKGVTKRQDRCDKDSLKFDYIWRNLDSFFQKLAPEDVDELNFKFIQMAYERVARK